MTALLACGMRVLVETGGHISVARVPVGVVKVVDVKCPASGEAGRNHWPNLDLLTPADQVKFVIQNRADYEFAQQVIVRHQLDTRCEAVLCSPVHDVLAPRDLASWILADNLPVRLQLQVHKYIWGAHVRGV